MEKNDGQRRRDAADGYAPFEVRPALRRDPEPSIRTAVLAYAALIVVGLIIGAVVYFVRMPMLNTIFQTLPTIFPIAPPV